MAQKPTLLIMAAGMGSRYGGLKQIDPMGPSGETIMDYSVFDAMRAGFGKLVFIIRKDIEEPFRRAIGSRFDRRIPVSYVFQELNDLPAGFSVPEKRTKPWGTGQAILAAANEIQEPFAAINADDFYGAESFQVLAHHLMSGSPDHAMVGFILNKTLSDSGTVTRGICDVGEDGYLVNVTEIAKIKKTEGGAASYTDASDRVHQLSGHEAVSMNMWGFMPSLFPALQAQWTEFLRRSGQALDSELYIPTVVGNLVTSGQIRCKVLPTNDAWFGVTHQGDRPIVVENIRHLVDRGSYPRSLWGAG